MSAPKPDHSHATLTSKSATESDLARQLQTIRAARKKLTAEEVNYVREAYVLDRRTVPAIQESLYPQISQSALWGIIRGRTYRDVPLSPRLKRAYRVAVERRKVPVHVDNLLPEDETA